MSDQDRISPCNINTISSRQVMRIKKNINKGTINRSNTKFSKLLLSFLFLGSPMRHLSAGTPSSDDFDLDGSMSPEVKYVISHESFHRALFNCFY